MGNKIPLAFVKTKPISELPEISTLQPGGNMLVQLADGTTKRISTEAFYQILNNIARPISPTDSGPFIADRWYKPTISSDDPGTNYPNAGDLKAKSGFDSLFWYDGTNWTKTEVALPGTTAEQVFDETDNVNASTMKAAADRYDVGLKVLKWFVSGGEYIEKHYKNADVDKNLFGIQVNNTGQLLEDNTINIDNTAPYFTWHNIPLQISSTKKITRIEIDVVRFGGVGGASLLGVKDNGDIDVLVSSMGTPSGQLESYTFDVSAYHYISYSYYTWPSFPSTDDNQIKFYVAEGTGAGGQENAVLNLINNKISNVENKISDSTCIHCRITIEGQSNARGYATTNNLLNQGPFSVMAIDWLKAFSRVFIWNPNTNNYENLQLKVNNSGYYQPVNFDYFGTEIGIALVWLQTHKYGNLYIDKHTEDGKEIAYFQKGGSFYNSRLALRKASANQWLNERNINVNDVAFIWIQGESDMNNSEVYYLGALKTLIADRITDKFIKPSTNIILAQINPENNMYSMNVANAKNKYLNFNKQARSITYPNSTWDGVHLTTEGQVNLGLQAGQKSLDTDIYLISDIEEKYYWNI